MTTDSMLVVLRSSSTTLANQCITGACFILVLLHMATIPFRVWGKLPIWSKVKWCWVQPHCFNLHFCFVENHISYRITRELGGGTCRKDML